MRVRAVIISILIVVVAAAATIIIITSSWHQLVGGDGYEQMISFVLGHYPQDHQSSTRHICHGTCFPIKTAPACASLLI